MNPNPNYHMYQGIDDMLSLPDCTEAPTSTLINNISFLREKINQLDSLAAVIVSDEYLQHEPVVTISDAESVANEIITAASSAIDALHQIKLVHLFPLQNNCIDSNLFSMDMHYDGNTSNNPNYVVHESNAVNNTMQNQSRTTHGLEPEYNAASSSNNVDNNIVELDATALLLQYTSYCPICGKGFKRDANLRMHMRAHGDEYKTTEALAKPTDPCQSEENPGSSARYSCPQEGCRRNKAHPRFTPLKSMLCVKNHYKRCHCPKMYVCNKCNKKEFSILSDLRTHERICGLRWRCSCGTFFSRKDKLMGHVAMFTGHQPLGESWTEEPTDQEIGDVQQ